MKRKVHWLSTLFLSVFFGWIGVDRFLMGKTGTGLLKLISFGGLGAWWFIDIIMIASRYEYENIQWVMGKPDKRAAKKVHWILVLIMSIFFGELGVDRFLMGKTGTGILKLVSFGGLGIWWVIDLVLIASKYEFKGVQWIK